MRECYMKKKEEEEEKRKLASVLHTKVNYKTVQIYQRR